MDWIYAQHIKIIYSWIEICLAEFIFFKKKSMIKDYEVFQITILIHLEQYCQFSGSIYYCGKPNLLLSHSYNPTNISIDEEKNDN